MLFSHYEKEIKCGLQICLLIISQGLGKKIQTVCRRNIEFMHRVHSLHSSSFLKENTFPGAVVLAASFPRSNRKLWSLCFMSLSHLPPNSAPNLGKLSQGLATLRI